MKIYYKDIFKRDEFKLLNNEKSININRCVLKIVCPEEIIEVSIDDELIELSTKNDDLKKEFVYHKLNTSNKKYIEIVAKCKKNTMLVKYEKVIKIDEDNYIYNVNELDKIRQEGQKAYENIINFDEGYDKEEYSEVLINDFKQMLINPYEIIKAIKLIIKLSSDIIRSPKVELIGKEIIENTNRVKTINSNSARYFAMHSEDWYQEGENFPKPLNILTETFEENKNIYENQIIKYILKDTQKIVIKLIDNFEMHINTLKGYLIEKKNLRNSDNLDYDELKEIEADIEKLKKDREENKKLLNEFKKLKMKLLQILSEYKEIKLLKQINIKITQVILYDKRYLRIINLYKEKLKKLPFNIEDTRKVEFPIDYSYMFIICDILCRVLFYLGFKDIENVNIPSEFNRLFEKENIYTIMCEHQNKNMSCEIELYGIESNYPNQIVVKLIHEEKTDITKFIINYMDINRDIEMDYIDGLYDINNDYKCNTKLLLNTIALEKINFKTEEVKENGLYKLSNLGNNFITKKDYEKYGNFRQGSMQLSMFDLNKIYNKLIKFFRMKFIKLNFLEYCTFCHAGRYIQIEDGLLECNVCHKRIAINKCNNCGSDIIKFLSNKEIDEEFEYENIIDRHQNYEIYSNNLGSCYNNLFGNTGGFCSNCGHCQKYSHECIRCSIVDWEE